MVCKTGLLGLSNAPKLIGSKSVWHLTPANMNFLWPTALWLLAVIPALVVLYVWLIGRHRTSALSFSSLALIKLALGHRSRLRHVPPLLLLAAVATSIIAGARPTWDLVISRQGETILLVMDVSLSMRASDVAPDRIGAAQQAAKNFISALPNDVSVGVISYAGTAQLVQPPTLDKQLAVEALDRFQLQRGTAIGNGIAVGLATLFPDDGIDVSSLDSPRRSTHGHPPTDDRLVSKHITPVPPGSYRPAAIVLLTDGQNLMGFDPIAAAQMAADKGVRVFTVGIGTANGQIIDVNGWKMRVRLDEEILKHIANLTMARYFHAGTGGELATIYEDLASRLVLERKRTEVTFVFAAAAGLLTLLAAILSLWWFGRPA